MDGTVSVNMEGGVLTCNTAQKRSRGGVEEVDYTVAHCIHFGNIMLHHFHALHTKDVGLTRNDLVTTRNYFVTTRNGLVITRDMFRK